MKPWVMGLVAGLLIGATASVLLNNDKKASAPEVPESMSATPGDATDVAEARIVTPDASPSNPAPVSDQQLIIRELEERIAAKDGQIQMLWASLSSTASVPAVVASGQPDDRRDWLDQLRTNDPVRYQDMMERRDAAQKAAKYEIAKKAAHFLFRDESAMTGEEARQHQQMMGLLQESLQLTERLNAKLEGEDRREIVRELRRNMRELSPLLETERDRELFRIGKDLGYSDENAAGFALYIRDVIDLTSVQSIYRSAGRAMGGGWGGWGEGPPAGAPSPPR